MYCTCEIFGSLLILSTNRSKVHVLKSFNTTNKNKEKTSHLIKQTNQYYTSIEDKVHITQVKMVTIETNKQKTICSNQSL